METAHQALAVPGRTADTGFIRYCLALVRQRRSLLTIIAGCTLAGVAVAWLTPPRYQASATLQIEYLRGITRLDEADTGRPLPPPEAITETQLLTSRRVVGQVVRDLQLDVTVTPHRFPLLGAVLARRHERQTPDDVAAAPLGLTDYAWGGERLNLTRLDVPDALYGRSLTLRSEVAGGFTLLDEQGRTLLTGQPGRPAEGQEVQLTIAQLRARPGTLFSLVKEREEPVIQRYRQQLAVSERGKQSGILTVSFQEGDAQRARRIVQAVTTGYVNQDIERNADEYTHQLTFLRQELPRIRQRLVDNQQMLDTFQRRQGSVAVHEETRSLLKQAVALDEQLSALELERLQLKLRFTREHPVYQTLLDRRQQLEGARQDLQRRIDALPHTQQEILRLQREIESAGKTYGLISKRIQELAVVRAGTVSDVRLIDAAYVQDAPVFPKKPLIVLSALLFGCLAGAAWVYLRANLDQGIEAPDELERLDLPVFGQLPLSPRPLEYTTGRNAGSPLDEALRMLRTNLSFTGLEARNQVLLITGASPGVGKTTVATQLAAVAVQAGQRVLLIDADLRRGRLHHYFALDPRPGLAEALGGLATIDEVVQPTATPGLHCIAAGRRPPNPAELLMGTRCVELLRLLQRDYDLVILDTPPVLAVTDATLLAAQAATSLLVVRHGRNTVKEIEAAQRQFARSGLSVQGAVLNGIPPAPFVAAILAG